MALAVACILTFLFVLAPCEASRPSLLLRESGANASIPDVLRDAVNPANVDTTAVDVGMSTSDHIDVITASHVTPRALMERECRTSDIIIEQFESSGVGLPTFQVQILNTCTNPLCSISFVVVHCGEFHSGLSLVNPKVFRRWPHLWSGTCLVNDGQPIRNGDSIRFQYREIWKQPITFLSAHVFCHR